MFKLNKLIDPYFHFESNSIGVAIVQLFDVTLPFFGRLPLIVAASRWGAAGGPSLDVGLFGFSIFSKDLSK